MDQEAAEMLEKKIWGSLSPFEQNVLELYLKGLDYLQIAGSLQRPAKSVDNGASADPGESEPVFKKIRKK